MIMSDDLARTVGCNCRSQLCGIQLLTRTLALHSLQHEEQHALSPKCVLAMGSVQAYHTHGQS